MNTSDTIAAAVSNGFAIAAHIPVITFKKLGIAFVIMVGTAHIPTQNHPRLS